jgi:hypothetical protein
MNPWHFLGSRKHFVGSTMMLLGVGLALIDPIGPKALVLIAAFYLAGVVATPSRPPISRFGFDPEKVERRLARIISEVSGRLPAEAMIRLRRMELMMRTEILPRLDRLPPGSAELHLVRSTACDYLPGALDVYLCLPPGYVSTQASSEGRTALSILLEELDLLEAGMRSVAAAVHRANMDRLLAHRRFLLERFPQEPPAKLLS